MKVDAWMEVEAIRCSALQSLWYRLISTPHQWSTLFTHPGTLFPHFLRVALLLEQEHLILSVDYHVGFENWGVVPSHIAVCLTSHGPRCLGAPILSHALNFFLAPECVGVSLQQVYMSSKPVTCCASL